jgi:hypothetical protein
MKHRIKLIAYLTIMAVVISGSLFLADSQSHKNCPVCDHSLTKEGIVKTSPLLKPNKQ